MMFRLPAPESTYEIPPRMVRYVTYFEGKFLEEMLNGLPHTHVQRGACRREAQFSQSCQQHENATMSFQECGISLSSLLQVAEFLRIQHESARCVQ